MSQARIIHNFEGKTWGIGRNLAHRVKPLPQHDHILNTSHQPTTSRGATAPALPGVQGPQFEPPDAPIRGSCFTAELLYKIAKRISPKEYQATPTGVSLCAGEERNVLGLWAWAGRNGCCWMELEWASLGWQGNFTCPPGENRHQAGIESWFSQF